MTDTISSDSVAQDHQERLEQEALLDIYMGALGMLPLFEAGGDDD